MRKETEKAGRYRLFAARLRAIAAADVAQENRDLLHQVVDDFEQMAAELEAMDQLNRSIPNAVPRRRISY